MRASRLLHRAIFPQATHQSLFPSLTNGRAESFPAASPATVSQAPGAYSRAFLRGLYTSPTPPLVVFDWWVSLLLFPSLVTDSQHSPRPHILCSALKARHRDRAAYHLLQSHTEHQQAVRASSEKSASTSHATLGTSPAIGNDTSSTSTSARAGQSCPCGSKRCTNMFACTTPVHAHATPCKNTQK
jgi:hypothetical protein